MTLVAEKLYSVEEYFDMEERSKARYYPQALKNTTGQETYDVYLNNGAWFGNVPDYVWHYPISGYQVLKKWLPYREVSVLGRALTKEEVREWANTARRLAALLLLGSVLDANYRLISTSKADFSPALPVH